MFKMASMINVKQFETILYKLLLINDSLIKWVSFKTTLLTLF